MIRNGGVVAGSEKQKQIKKPEPLLVASEVEELFGLKESFIRKARAVYGFPHYKIAGSVRFRASEIEKWLNERRKAS